MLFIEKLFLRVFCKPTMWLVRLGIFAGAIDCICYITYVVNNVPNWDWIDFTNMPFFEIWVFGFIQIGVPYLFIAHIIRWFIPTIDDAFWEWQYSSFHIWHLIILPLLLIPPIRRKLLGDDLYDFSSYKKPREHHLIKLIKASFKEGFLILQIWDLIFSAFYFLWWLFIPIIIINFSKFVAFLGRNPYVFLGLIVFLITSLVELLIREVRSRKYMKSINH